MFLARWTRRSSHHAERDDYCAWARSAALLGVLALTGGCLYHPVHYVRQDANGGVLSIPSNTDIWPTRYLSRAKALMAEKCPNGYVIDKIEKVVANQPHSNDPRKVPQKYEYDGALVKVQEPPEYHIIFHALPPGGGGNGPPKPRSGPPAPPPASVPLPAPRPLPPAGNGFWIPPPPTRPAMPSDPNEPTLPIPRKLPDTIDE